MSDVRVHAVDALRARAREEPDGPALVWGGERWSYGELSQEVDAREASLRAQGLGAGQVVAMEARGHPDFVVTLVACWAVGAVSAPFHARAPEAERGYHDRLLRPAWRAGPGGELSRLRSGGEALDAGDRAVGAVVMTSGSSGRPRGVALSHEGLARSARATALRLDLRPDDTWGLALSPAHAGGMTTVARTLVVGSALRLWPRAADPGRLYDPAGLAADVLAGRVSHVSLVPVMLAGLLEAGIEDPVPGFRCALVGGAHLSEALLSRALAARVPVALTWGMTESTGQVATAPPAEVAEGGAGTVGRPLEGMEVRVDREGRLAVRGAMLAAGRVEAPGAPLTPLPLDRDGWLRTGDVGHVDEGGRVRVEGRADEMIITGGVNVSPREVEGVLLTAPGVADAVVWGVEEARWGQVVAAAVVADRAAAGHVDIEDLHRHCRAHLTRSRCPTHIVLVPSIPRTSTGKPALTRLAELLTTLPE